MTNFTWTVTSLYTVSVPTPDYVVLANYLVVGVDGEYHAETSGSSQFAVNPEQPNYIPYDQLTEAIVLGWIQAEPNVTINMEACVQGQIDSQINPPVTPQDTPLPWAN
jgi:hypothetical protein